MNHAHSLMPDLSPADRQLVELSAKAAGIRLEPGTLTTGGWDGHSFTYNPLDDDGQSLRLQVRIGMTVDTSDARFVVATVPRIGFTAEEMLNGPSYDEARAATRRAVVRCAAEQGKAMP